MAAPGTFTSGQVLTAAEMNALPGGIIARVSATSNGTASGTESVLLTTPSFTAVAGRLYKITYYEGSEQTPAGAGNYTINRIRLTNATGTQYAQGQLQASGATQTANAITTMAITTLSAGSTVIVATAQCNTGTVNLFRSATLPAFLVVEDIGPS